MIVKIEVIEIDGLAFLRTVGNESAAEVLIVIGEVEASVIDEDGLDPDAVLHFLRRDALPPPARSRHHPPHPTPPNRVPVT